MLLHFTLTIVVSNGKHFLIQTNDNEIGYDYNDYNDTPGPPGCNPKKSNFNQEIACVKGR